MIQNFFIQCSSKSWAGDVDDSMALFGDEPIICHTINKINQHFNVEITLIAPAFDRGGELDLIADKYKNVDVTYSHDDSPLDRLISSSDHLNEGDYIVRLNGLNMAFLSDFVNPMYDSAKNANLDIIKFKDDMAPPLTYEIYRVGSLVRVRNEINKLRRLL